MKKVLFTVAFVVSGPISAMALSEPTPAPAADDADSAILELFEQQTEPETDAVEVETATEAPVEAAPAEVPQSQEPAIQQQQVQPQQPVMYQQQQPQQQRYYYYQQQSEQGFFSRLMELERRKNRFLLRMIGINRE